jgi:hypothetical protein
VGLLSNSHPDFYDTIKGDLDALRREVRRVPKVRVEVSLEDIEPKEVRPGVHAEKRMVEKSISFVCGIEEGHRIFRAACDAAAEEKENGKEEKVGGTS